MKDLAEIAKINYSEDKVFKLNSINFKDEFEMLDRLKKMHSRILNIKAATKIQKIARGWLIRKRLRLLI